MENRTINFAEYHKWTKEEQQHFTIYYIYMITWNINLLEKKKTLQITAIAQVSLQTNCPTSMQSKFLIEY